MLVHMKDFRDLKVMNLKPLELDRRRITAHTRQSSVTYFLGNVNKSPDFSIPPENVRKTKFL